MTWKRVSRSAQQTRRWGRLLGQSMRGGEIVGLVGELGTGKTVLVRGVAEGLGVGKDAWIRSPTFTLINEYAGRLPVYHIDLYRVGSREELEGLNLREYLYGAGVSLIEWCDKLPEEELNEHLKVTLVHGGGTVREVAFSARGVRYESLLRRLKAEMASQV